MSDTDSIEFLQQTVMNLVRARGWDPSERGLAISITLEAAELLDHFQWEDYELREDQNEIYEELADVIIYILQFAHKRNIDIGQAVVDKLKKSAQKYPAGLSAQEHYQAKLAKRKGIV